VAAWPQAPSLASARLDAVFRAERGRILATLIAILRDFERSEEAVRALEQAVWLAATGPERRLLASRIAALSGQGRR
jgi:hypothetical protein